LAVAEQDMEVGLPISGKGILNHLGIIKNELLVFAVIVCLILNASAYPLDKPVNPKIQIYGGLAMHLASVLLLFFFGGFYCYAFLKLPGSGQELTFVSNAEKELRRYKRKPKKAAVLNESPEH
jgi:hypothetical protein